MKTRKEIIEGFIDQIKSNLVWYEACLASLEIQKEEKNHQENDIHYQQSKNEFLVKIETDTRMLEIFEAMKKALEKKEPKQKKELES